MTMMTVVTAMTTMNPKDDLDRSVGELASHQTARDQNLRRAARRPSPAHPLCLTALQQPLPRGIVLGVCMMKRSSSMEPLRDAIGVSFLESAGDPTTTHADSGYGSGFRRMQ